MKNKKNSKQTLSWAENEVRLACERERSSCGSENQGDWDYGCACYESALKAYKSLKEDGHSGLSIGVTKNILNRLIDHKPLTAIEDTDDIWHEAPFIEKEGITVYQCKRFSSLFKFVNSDGMVTYKDNGRFICEDINNPGVCYESNFINMIMNNIYPVKMPYFPESKTFKVFCEYGLTDEKNGDYDTLGIHYVIEPNGNPVDISKYFKEIESDLVEIDAKEYADRMMMHASRLLKKGFQEKFGKSTNDVIDEQVKDQNSLYNQWKKEKK